jgi:hypothetical protein
MGERKGSEPAVAWSWPKDQRVTYKVTPDKPGSLNAVSVAKQMLAICKLLEAREDGMSWRTLLIAVYTEADGSFTFELGIAPKKSAIAPPPEVSSE